MSETPTLDELLRMLPSSPERVARQRRVLDVPVHALSLIGQEIALPGCTCDLIGIVDQTCKAIGECPNPPGAAP